MAGLDRTERGPRAHHPGADDDQVRAQFNDSGFDRYGVRVSVVTADFAIAAGEKGRGTVSPLAHVPIRSP